MTCIVIIIMSYQYNAPPPSVLSSGRLHLQNLQDPVTVSEKSHPVCIQPLPLQQSLQCQHKNEENIYIYIHGVLSFVSK